MEMIATVRTSMANRKLVHELTRRFGFRAENTIARICLAYSLSQGRIAIAQANQDSRGKEYPCRVLFGGMMPYYVALLCQLYDKRLSQTELARYTKLHLDDGIERIAKMVEDSPKEQAWDQLEELVVLGLGGLGHARSE